MIFRIVALLTIAFLAACGGGGGGGSGNSGGNNSSNNVVSSTNNTSSVASSTNVISSTASSSANNSSSIANTSASSILGSTANTSSAGSSAQANHQIALIAAPVSGGTVNGAGEYAAGSDVEVTAIPAENFLFVNWKESGVVVSTSATYTFKAEANRSLVANFVMEGPGQEEGWSHSFDATGESGGTSAREVAMDAAGNIYLAGVTSADLDGTYGESERHYYVAKYTALGIPLYLKQFPALAPTTVTNTTVTNIEGLATDGDGNLYLLRMAVNSGPVEQQIPIVHKFRRGRTRTLFTGGLPDC